MYSYLCETSKSLYIILTWISTGEGGDWLNIQSSGWIAAFDELYTGGGKLLGFIFSRVLKFLLKIYQLFSSDKIVLV